MPVENLEKLKSSLRVPDKIKKSCHTILNVIFALLVRNEKNKFRKKYLAM